MNDPPDNRNIFDSYAENYREIINRSARLSGERFEYFVAVRLELMRRELERRTGREDGFALLDFGCGIGETEKIMTGIFPRSTLTGIDESIESIARAMALSLVRTRFFVARGLPLPLADLEFDAVYSNGTFHHIAAEGRPDMFRELWRVVKPGGHLFVFENNPRNPFMMRAMRTNPFDAGLAAIAPSQLDSVGRLTGWSPLVTRYYFFFPRVLRALRPLEKALGNVPWGAQYYTIFRKPLAGDNSS